MGRIASGSYDKTVRIWDAGTGRRVIGRGGGSLTIGLCRCDGGEQVDVLQSADADLLEFVGDRDSNGD